MKRIVLLAVMIGSGFVGASPTMAQPVLQLGIGSNGIPRSTFAIPYGRGMSAGSIGVSAARLNRRLHTSKVGGTLGVSDRLIVVTTAAAETSPFGKRTNGAAR
jgi:hypothetical protein